MIGKSITNLELIAIFEQLGLTNDEAQSVTSFSVDFSDKWVNITLVVSGYEFKLVRSRIMFKDEGDEDASIDHDNDHGSGESRGVATAPH
jgi:hypothetical protein